MMHVIWGHEGFTRAWHILKMIPGGRQKPLLSGRTAYITFTKSERIRPPPRRSLLRTLFPKATHHAGLQLHRLRFETLPLLKHRAQSRIFRYIQGRQHARGAQSILGLLRRHGGRISGNEQRKNEPRGAMTDYTYGRGRDDVDREPGWKRTKLKGYLKAANDLRQSYQQNYSAGWGAGQKSMRLEDEHGNPYPDAMVAQSGAEEMILFPSYARRHTKSKPQAQPGTIQEEPGAGRDIRDTSGTGDAEFWRQRWEEYEDDNAVVDVDVRGWVFSPHKGQMSRKQRFLVRLARQLAGLPSPPSPGSSPRGSRSSSPHSRLQEKADSREERKAAEEAEAMLERAKIEGDAAERGLYSEGPNKSTRDNLRRIATNNSSNQNLASIVSPVQKRAAWSQPGGMSPAEVAVANANLMARLKPFIANPHANSAISVFFFNDTQSRHRPIYTDPYGHFALRAALDFVPTHVRVLASEDLSVVEKVIITEAKGVSVISDIDDTIKHTAITSGAREMFRNAFIRDLDDLSIDGVREWYNQLAGIGVHFHYVSNSPWQLFPVLTKFFSLAGLPPGSFHLKQYSGMLQGIFEPVAERKKSTLDRIARDFPERKFLLIGDSGEADLEVYTDFVLENPGRVLAVYIRDVTTTDSPGFFDAITPGSKNPSGTSASPLGSRSASANASSSEKYDEDDDSDLKAAIEASIRDLAEEERRRGPSLPPRRIWKETEDLIDLNDAEPPKPGVRRSDTEPKVEPKTRRRPLPPPNLKSSPAPPVMSASPSPLKSAPPPPAKPLALRTSTSTSDLQYRTEAKKAPPVPKPRRPSANPDLQSSSSSSSPTSNPRKVLPPPPPRRDTATSTSSQQSYTSTARKGISAVYNHLPAAPSLWSSAQANPGADRAASISDERPPPPPPRPSTATKPPPQTAATPHADDEPAPALPSRRNNLVAYPAAAAQFAQSRVTNAWNAYYGGEAQVRGYASSGSGSTPGTEGVNKREQMWRARWATAERVMRDRGVVLKGWRVGTDLAAESVELVRRAEEEARKEREEREREQGRRERGGG
ncbi:actin patch protein 1 [Trichodelitschia bisporula]|uniref:Actin patch protein 1 n=1 Tax=Trichodelitschia bisporula TaxID=703511 RepID=A0A6G1I9T1_9PEZI|nr:actin patch protein 1 [Trichodelitschia bisporula]